MFNVRKNSTTSWNQNFIRKMNSLNKIKSWLPAVTLAGFLNWLVLKNSAQGRKLWRCRVYNSVTLIFWRLDNDQDDLSKYYKDEWINRWKVLWLQIICNCWTVSIICRSTTKWYFYMRWWGWKYITTQLFVRLQITHLITCNRLKRNESVRIQERMAELWSRKKANTHTTNIYINSNHPLTNKIWTIDGLS